MGFRCYVKEFELMMHPKTHTCTHTHIYGGWGYEKLSETFIRGCGIISAYNSGNKGLSTLKGAKKPGAGKPIRKPMQLSRKMTLTPTQLSCS